MKKYWELAELENKVFLRRPFWIFEVGHFEFFFASSLWKIQPFYEISFFSALWMVFPESWKRSCPNFYAHDCTWKNFEKANIWFEINMSCSSTIFLTLIMTNVYEPFFFHQPCSRFFKISYSFNYCVATIVLKSLNKTLFFKVMTIQKDCKDK